MVWYGMLRYGTNGSSDGVWVCYLSGGLRPDSIIIIIAFHTQQCWVLDACMCWHGRGGLERESVPTYWFVRALNYCLCMNYRSNNEMKEKVG